MSQAAIKRLGLRHAISIFASSDLRGALGEEGDEDKKSDSSFSFSFSDASQERFYALVEDHRGPNRSGENNDKTKSRKRRAYQRFLSPTGISSAA